MDDIVGRLMRELPDTDKDRYDIAYERGRAQARSSLVAGGLAAGLAAGAVDTPQAVRSRAEPIRRVVVRTFALDTGDTPRDRAR